MIYNMKGFFAYSTLILNVPNQVSPFGELSPNSLSYAKDKLFYTNNEAAPQTTLVSFHSVGNNAAMEVPPTVADNALRIGEFLLVKAQEGQIPDDPYLLRQQVSAEFQATIQDFTCGEIKTGAGVKLPEWIAYTDKTWTGNTSTVTIWLADDSFANQYDEYEIEVIPPIEPLDDFFKDPLIVRDLLNAYNIVEKLEETQAAQAGYPYTKIQALRYDYQNPLNTTFQVPSYWIVIIYGQAGNNPDLVREAIVDYVLDNSTHTQDEWAAILPDLFRTTEFIITPLWNQYSVPNAEFQAGIYSPTVDPRKNLALLQRTARGNKYTSAYVNANYEISTILYKSLAFGVLGNPDNKGGITAFSKKFPDYMLASNDTPDFNRMSVETQEFVVLLGKLIVAAETFTRFSRVPTGMARVIRDNVVYVSQFYKNVNYLVVSKPSVEDLQ